MPKPKRNPEGINREKSATSPISQCTINTVLYPVRFALKNDTLKKIANGEQKELPPATNINESPLHELRRLRQGYVYIYTTPVENTTDTKTDKDLGVWHIYQYNTTPKDSNGQTEVNHDTAMPFHFQKYEWQFLGNNEVKWIPREKYTTIPISCNIGTVWIAYSEFRWPHKLFLELQKEKNEGLRKKFMQQVVIGKNKDARESNFTTSIRHLDKMVPDFQKDVNKKKLGASNFLRHTSVGYNEKDPVSKLDFSNSDGVLIAVQDTLGEILDIAAMHGAYYQNRVSAFSLYEYPLQTAMAVTGLEKIIVKEKYFSGTIASSIRKAWDDIDEKDPHLNIFKLKPDDTLNNTLIQDFAEQLEIDASKLKSKRLMDKFVDATQHSNTMVKNIVNAQWALINSQDRKDFSPRLKQLLQYIIDGKIAPHTTAQYLCYVGSQMFKNLNLSAEGKEITNKKLKALENIDPQSKESKVSDKDLAISIIQNVLKYFEHYANSQYRLPLYYLDTFIETFSYQLISQYSGLRTGNQSTTTLHARERIQQISRIYRVELGYLPDADVEVQRRALINMVEDVRSHVTLTVSTSSSVSSTTVVEQETTCVTQNLGSIEGDSYRKLPNAGLLADGGAMLLGWVVIFQTSFESKAQYSKIGMLAENRFLVLGQALADNIQATRSVLTAENLTRVKNLWHNGMVTLRLKNAELRGVTAVVSNNGTASGSIMKQLFKRANFISFVGIGLSVASAMDGVATEDMAKFYSNLLNAGGSTALILAGGETSLSGVFFVVGLLMIAGGLTLSIFETSDLEEWIEFGFWGESGKYWGGYEDGWFSNLWQANRLDSFKEQFELAKNLNSIYDPSVSKEEREQLQTDYAIEMGRLSDFLQPIKIVAGEKQSVYIRWHGLLKPSDAENLTIRGEWHTGHKSQIPKGGLTVKNIRHFGNPEPCSFKASFIEKGVARFEVSPRDLRIISVMPEMLLTKALKIEVTAPRIASASGTIKGEAVIMLDKLK